ncbi:hypothetical protein [Mycobacterium sp. ST-F2]|nr:hypothetical protein [Mycobacterium sp. ST-F2]
MCADPPVPASFVPWSVSPASVPPLPGVCVPPDVVVPGVPGGDV